MNIPELEKKMVEDLTYARSTQFNNYNSILGYYQVMSCLEHAREDTALDLACGDGLVTSMLKPYFKRIVGVDASGKLVKSARKKVPDVEFVESLIEEYETEEKFDTVFMLNILEHVFDPASVLKKATSFLKKNGVLIVHVPNAEAVNRKIAVIMGTLERCGELSPYDIDVLGHRRSYTITSLRDDIEGAGLRVLKTGGIFYKMLSTPQMDWFLKNGLWEEGGFGWGRVSKKNKKDWKTEFCRACYEFGKSRPEDCNIIYACIEK